MNRTSRRYDPPPPVLHGLEYHQGLSDTDGAVDPNPPHPTEAEQTSFVMLKRDLSLWTTNSHS